MNKTNTKLQTLLAQGAEGCREIVASYGGNASKQLDGENLLLLAQACVQLGDVAPAVGYLNESIYPTKP